MDRNRIIELISEYEDGMREPRYSDEEIDKKINEIDGICPNSEFTGLYFYPEIDRTTEEMADEMILREEIFATGGREAIDKHIATQMKNALDMPPSSQAKLYSAYQGLRAKDPAAAKQYEHLIWPDGKPER